MQPSQIVVSKAQEEPSGDPQSQRLRHAYQNERKKLELTEVELNRSKIFMIDQDGNIKRVSLLSEH
ncbi:hypothetical protein M1D72_03390 [Vibrio sp. AK197]|uniref:Uncharacterized protein n=1 Tax=Vibrio olivae TaxID=1243002 RepID=A0ABV5HRC6_9VIBR